MRLATKDKIQNKQNTTNILPQINNITLSQSFKNESPYRELPNDKNTGRIYSLT